MNRNCTRNTSLYKKMLWIFLSCCLLWTAIPANAQGAGYWHTSGNQILDSNNQPVRMAGVNWYGFETPDRIIHGLWAQDYKVILNTIKSNGYNVIRIPYSSEMVETNPKPTNFSVFNTGPINTDLQGLTALQILDKIVSFAGSIGLRVILDHHRSEAGSSAEGNGLWFTSTFSDSAWINDWVALTNRYLNNTTVIGMDLHNEPHNATSGGACWGCGSTTNDWRLAAQRAGNAVLAVNPHLLIFVEGTDCFNGDCNWWGGNLEGVSQFPVTLNVPNQLVYSAHEYGPSLASQPWLNGSTTSATLQNHWNTQWGYIHNNNIAPVWVGEFGTGNNASDVQGAAAGSEGQWFSGLVQYISARPAMSWTYWALNGEDSFAILDSNYDSTPVSAAKQQLLAGIQFPLGGSGGTTTPTITAINPASALPGASVTITGTNFSATANADTVTFGSAGATVTAATTTSLTVTVPNIAAGAANVTVSVAGKSSNAVGFTVNSSTSTTPTISAINPTSALPGASVIITGTNFSATANANTVTFGSAGATVTAASTTSLTVTVPNITAGALNVIVSVGGKNSNAVGFTVNANNGGSGCHITYAITNSWSTGFQVAITIANTGTTAINNWSLAWTFPGNQQINNLWNGALTQTGTSVTVNSLNYNGNIPVGGSYKDMGFVANGAAATPASFSLNGTRCQ